MENLTHRIYRADLNNREEGTLLTYLRYTSESNMTVEEKETLKLSYFQLGENVRFSDEYGGYDGEHTIDVIDRVDGVFYYLIDLDKGGADIWGWLEVEELEHLNEYNDGTQSKEN